MNNAISQLSSSMEQRRAVADTIGLCQGATPRLKLSCFDGKAATNNETPDNPSDNANNTGSLLTCTPPQKSLVDQLGDIKTNTWF